MNLPKSALEFLSAFAQKNHIKFVIVPVSSPKMVRMPQFLHAVDWLIINRDESETYLNMSIRNISDMQRAAEKWVELGVSNVIITNGLEPLILKIVIQNTSYLFLQHSILSMRLELVTPLLVQ